jgi:transposase
MRPSVTLNEVYLCLEPVDFRKGMMSLAAMVESSLELGLFDTRLFVFTNRTRTGIKILYWERNGFCLWQKRLERDRFHWLHRPGEPVAVITGQQLNWLLDGCDMSRMQSHGELKYCPVS